MVVTVIVVAAVLLYNTGAPEGDEQTQNPVVESQGQFDPGPAWQPNQSALDELGYGNAAVDAETEFDPGPAWQPNQSQLDSQRTSNQASDPETDFAGVPAPQWEPSQSTARIDNGIDRADQKYRSAAGREKIQSIEKKWNLPPNFNLDYFGTAHFEAVDQAAGNKLLPRSDFASDYDWLVANGLGFVNELLSRSSFASDYDWLVANGLD